MRIRGPFGGRPCLSCILISKPAIPETIAVAQLVPPRTSTRLCGSAPRTFWPIASNPWPLYWLPQLLVSKGTPPTVAAPTARTDGCDAGTWRQSHPSFPAAATMSAPLDSHPSITSLRSRWGVPEAVNSPPLILIMLAPRSKASVIACARSSWEHLMVAPSSESSNIGMTKPEHCGATPTTGPSCWPKTMLATYVPWSAAGPESRDRVNAPATCSRRAPANAEWWVSTGPSSTAMQTRSSPKVWRHKSESPGIATAKSKAVVWRELTGNADAISPPHTGHALLSSED